MADEIVQGSVRGPNGDEVRFAMGTKSIGITTRDLPLLVVIVGMGVGFYLAFQALTDRMERTFVNQAEGFHKIEQVLDLMHKNQQEMITEIRSNREQMGTLVRDQNQLLAEQTSTFNGLLQTQTTEMKHDLADLKQRITISNWNATHEPAQQIPMDLPPEQFQRRQEGVR